VETEVEGKIPCGSTTCGEITLIYQTSILHVKQYTVITILIKIMGLACHKIKIVLKHDKVNYKIKAYLGLFYSKYNRTKIYLFSVCHTVVYSRL
jgi:hypothetical protein